MHLSVHMLIEYNTNSITYESFLRYVRYFDQGTSQSMPWLAELVESSEGSLDVLPVQCLCEFLLHYPSEITRDQEDDDDTKGRKNQVSKHKVI